MRKLGVFNHVTLDGFFADGKGDMQWAHQNADEEFNAFTSGNAGGEAEFLFGRKTYDMMASFWPTPMAAQAMPEVARSMNESKKTVFSRSLDKAAWSNTRLVKGDLASEVRAMKAAPGPDILIFGSGTLVSQLSQERLIDQYQLVLNPLILGNGRTLFEGLKERLSLKLREIRSFKNGNVLLTYGLS